MSQVINAILQPFWTIIHFVSSLATGLVQLVQNIVLSLQFFDKAMAALPPVLYVIALAFIGIAVVYLIIGR